MAAASTRPPRRRASRPFHLTREMVEYFLKRVHDASVDEDGDCMNKDLRAQAYEVEGRGSCGLFGAAAAVDLTLVPHARPTDDVDVDGWPTRSDGLYEVPLRERHLDLCIRQLVRRCTAHVYDMCAPAHLARWRARAHR